MLTNIQIFRGLAALMVMSAHFRAHFPSQVSALVREGRSGVAFFFILSGFIIHYSSASRVGHPGEFGPFILKRLIRIYPIYWMICLGYLALEYYAQSAYSFSLLRFYRDPMVIGAALLLIPGPASMDDRRAQIINPAWTLQYELLFYLYYSSAFISKRAAKLIGVIWMAAVVSRYALGLAPSPAVLDQLTRYHVLYFFVGIGISHVIVAGNASRIASSAAWGLLIAGISALFVGWCVSYGLGDRYDEDSFLRFFNYGIPYGMIILAGGLLDSHGICLAGRGWIKRALQYLGDASYSLYLAHWGLLAALITLLNYRMLSVSGRLLEVPIQMVIGYMLTLGISLMIYSFIERPMLAGLRRLVFGKRTAS